MKKPQTPMSNVQQNPKPQCPKVWDFECWDLIGHWSLVIGILTNSKFSAEGGSASGGKVQNSHQQKTRGFSLIELMVTTSIIAIISSIVLFNFPSFASRILLENLTHEIALVVRQAQVYGIGIKQTSSGLFPAYGAHFDTDDTVPLDPNDSPPNKKVIFFADIDGDGLYDAEEGLETFTIQRGNIISDICYQDDFATWQCGVDTLDVTFKRPEPEAQIFAAGAGSGLSATRITVTSPSAEIGDRYITVYSSGQIAVTAD